MYAEMIEGNAKPYAQWKWLEQCELQKRYYMMLVSLDESERLLEQWNAAEMRLWFFAVRNILEDIGQGEGALAVFPLRFREDRLFAVLHRAHSLDAMAEALKDGMGAWIDQVQQHGTRKEDAQAIVAKAKNYIANCYHRDISIDEAADYAGVSVSHFCHLFKQETGMTFLEYLTKWRMDKARYMLEHTDVKVYRIAPLVGYQDAKYFTQVFKKMIGMKPSQYREQARRRKTIDNIPNQIMMESN